MAYTPDFLLTVGINTSISLEQMQKDIGDLIEDLNKQPQKIKIGLEIDQQAIENFKAEITNIHNSLNNLGTIAITPATQDSSINNTSEQISKITGSMRTAASSAHTMEAAIKSMSADKIEKACLAIEGISTNAVKDVVNSLKEANVVISNVEAKVQNLGKDNERVLGFTIEGSDIDGNSVKRVIEFDKKTQEVKKDVTTINGVITKLGSNTEKQTKKMSDGFAKAKKQVSDYYAVQKKFKKYIDTPNGISLESKEDGNSVYTTENEKLNDTVSYLNLVKEGYDEAENSAKNFSKQEQEAFEAFKKRKELEYKAIKEDSKNSQSTKSKDLLSVLTSSEHTVNTITSKLANWTTAKYSANIESRRAYDALNDENEALQEAINQQKAGKISLEDLDAANKKANTTLTETEAVLKKNGDATKSFKDKFVGLAKKFSAWFSASQAVMQAVNALKKMFSVVKEVDTAMTELRKVTNETESTYERFLENAVSRSKTLGATLSDTISATADFARLGYGLSDAEKLSDAAIVYKNVGDGIDDINTASESIIATMQAFGIAADDVMNIVDKFNSVGNNYAISSKGVGDALLRSAAAMHAANNSLDQTIALAAAANTIIQDPEKVGTTLKTISMFLRASKEEAEEAGESTEGMANSVSELRQSLLSLTGGVVDIQIDDKTFKDTYTIIKELSQEWDKLDDITQANITELIGGKRNSNVASALLENFSVAEKALETSATASGSALAENEKYLDSIQGRLTLLKTEFENLSTSLIDSEFVKTFIDLGTGVLKFLDGGVDTVGSIGAIISAVAGVSGLFKGGLLNFDVKKKELSVLGNVIGKVDKNTKKAGLSFNFATLKMKGMQLATNLLVSSLTTLALSLVSMAITAFVENVVNNSEKAAQAAEELKSNFDETTTTINDNLKSIEGFSEEFKKLSKGVDENGNNIALTTSEYSRYKEIVEQLVDMNPDLLKGYNSEYEAIINKNGAIEQTIELLKEQRKQEAQKAVSYDSLKTLTEGTEDYLERIKEKFQNSEILSFRNTLMNGMSLPASKVDASKLYKYWDMSSAEFLRNIANFKEDYKSVYNDLLASGEIDQEAFDKTIDYVVSTSKYFIETYQPALKELDTLSQSLNSTLQLIPTTLPEYENLSSGQKSFLTSYINSFKISFEEDIDNFCEDMSKYIDEVSAKRDEIIALVESMPDDVALTTGINLAYEIDFSTDTVEEYKQKIEEAIDYIINSDFNKDEEGNPIYKGEEGRNQIKLMLGFAVETNEGEIKDKVEDTKDKVKNKLSGVFNLSDKELESKLKIPIKQLEALAEVDLSDLSQFKSFAELMEYIQTMDGKNPFEFISSDWTEDVDKAVDKANKITGLIEKINNGEASQTDIWDTLKDFDEFPELLPYINDTEALKKKLVEISQVEQNDLIAQLESLKARLTDPEQIKGCEALISLLRELDVLSGGKSKETYINDYLKYQQDKIEDIVDNLEEEKEAQEDILDNLESQKEELEEQKQLIEDIIADYETAASTVTTVLEDKIQELTDQNDELEQAYEDQIANIEERYNTEIEALQEKNDEINRSIELKKKEDELYNAKRTRVRVYSESGGWTEQTDSQAVKEKTQELQSLQRQYAIEDLENQRDKEIKALEDKKENDPRLKKYAEEIEAYEKYMEAFEKMVESYEREQNDLTTARILGVNWHEQVLNRDTGLIQTYGRNYTSYQKQLYEDIEKEIEAKDLAIKKQQEVIDSRDTEIEHWNDFKTDLQNVVEDITGTNESYLIGLDNILINEKMSYQDRIDALAKFKKDVARLNELGDNPTIESVEKALGLIQSSDYIDGVKINNGGYSGVSAPNLKKTNGYEVYYIDANNKKVSLGKFSDFTDARKRKTGHIDLLKKGNTPDSKYLKEQYNLHLDKHTPDTEFIRILNQKIRIEPYLEGGTVDYTGLAMVHGSQQRAETTFNARDSKKLYELVHKTSDLSALIANNINANLLKAFTNIKTIKAVNPDTNLAFNFYGATIQADNYESFERCMNTYLSQARMNNWVGK